MNKLKDIVINEAVYMVNMPFSPVTFVHDLHCGLEIAKNNHPCMFPPQHSIIYYLCILIKDPGDPETVTSVVPLFPV